MIDPRELRIGNLIRINGKELTIAINTIQEIIQHKVKPPEIRKDKWEAIPLTSELLERFGFTNAEKVMSEPTGKGMFFIQVSSSQFLTTDLKRGWEMCHKEQGGKIVPTPCPQLKFCHQLQNLYFALTGKELELKQKP